MILKPTVSANARKTFVVPRQRLAELLPSLNRELDGLEVLAQPFLKDIMSDGEDSLFYFDGRFSHAVRKVPKGGAFLAVV